MEKTKVKVGCFAKVYCEKEIWVDDPSDLIEIEEGMFQILAYEDNCQEMGDIIRVEVM